MALWYCRSGATGAANGLDWADAVLTIAAGITLMSAGDTLYISEDHAESAAAAKSFTPPGAIGNPCFFICVNHSGSVPPVEADLRTTATVTTTGNFGIQIDSGTNGGYWYGIQFPAGVGGSSSDNLSVGGGSTNGPTSTTLENCKLTLSSTGPGSVITVGGSGSGTSPAQIKFKNTTLKFTETSHGISIAAGSFTWLNTASAIDTGGSTPTTLIKASTTAPMNVLFDGVDLSALGSGKTLMFANTIPDWIQIVNCKLGASVTVSATPAVGGAAGGTDLINSDSSATGYRQERYRYQGTLTTETTDVRSGGASDGHQGISWKVATTANSNWTFPFECFQIVQWVDATGSPITLNVEILNDGVTLNNNDVWLDLEYLGSSSQPLSSLATSNAADILQTPSAIPTSSVTWTTTGLTTPIKQVLQVTFAPQIPGYIRGMVRMAKASKTVWVDPVLHA